MAKSDHIIWQDDLTGGWYLQVRLSPDGTNYQCVDWHTIGVFGTKLAAIDALSAANL